MGCQQKKSNGSWPCMNECFILPFKSIVYSAVLASSSYSECAIFPLFSLLGVLIFLFLFQIVQVILIFLLYLFAIDLSWTLWSFCFSWLFSWLFYWNFRGFFTAIPLIVLIFLFSLLFRWCSTEIFFFSFVFLLLFRWLLWFSCFSWLCFA